MKYSEFVKAKEEAQERHGEKDLICVISAEELAHLESEAREQLAGKLPHDTDSVLPGMHDDITFHVRPVNGVQFYRRDKEELYMCDI